MCTREKNNPAYAGLSAWQLIDRYEGPTHHFYQATSGAAVLRLAIEALQEHQNNPDLCHLYQMCRWLEQEIQAGIGGLEEALGEVQVGH